MDNSVYSPAEDSFFMSDYLSKTVPKLAKKNPGLKFLEMGAGSGINLERAFNSGIKKQNIFSCDINPKAVLHCKSLGFNCIKSDLFNRIPKNNKFDIIIFNPPYLPEDEFYPEPKVSKTATTGGKKGNEIIIKFLTQAKNYLDKSGMILIITSSLAEKVDFNKLGYNSRKIAEKNLFFERLFLWKLITKKLH